jgi:hypothetical protein
LLALAAWPKRPGHESEACLPLLPVPGGVCVCVCVCVCVWRGRKSSVGVDLEAMGPPAKGEAVANVRKERLSVCQGRMLLAPVFTRGTDLTTTQRKTPRPLVRVRRAWPWQGVAGGERWKGGNNE